MTAETAVPHLIGIENELDHIARVVTQYSDGGPWDKLAEVLRKRTRDTSISTRAEHRPRVRVI